MAADAAKQAAEIRRGLRAEGAQRAANSRALASVEERRFWSALAGPGRNQVLSADVVLDVENLTLAAALLETLKMCSRSLQVCAEALEMSRPGSANAAAAAGRYTQ